MGISMQTRINIEYKLTGSIFLFSYLDKELGLSNRYFKLGETGMMFESQLY